MVNPMVWIDDTVVYRAQKGQKTKYFVYEQVSRNALA